MGDAMGEDDTFGDECPFLPYKTDMFKSPESYQARERTSKEASKSCT